MAPGLNLPPPKVVAQDESLEAESSSASSAPKKATVEDVDEVTESSTSNQPNPTTSSAKKFASTAGLIYPPPDIRQIVDKTASFVARNGSQFESKIKSDERTNTKFAFLDPNDPYHQYYRTKIDFILNPQNYQDEDLVKGLSANSTSGRTDGQDANLSEEQQENAPEEPYPFEFSAQLPNITAVDLDIIKLTALFTAQNGRTFASSLQAREGRSYQFEFLRSSHSLFPFFNHLVSQYQQVINPPQESLDRLKSGLEGFQLKEVENGGNLKPKLGPGKGGQRMQILQETKKRSEWEKWMREKRKKKESEEEEQKALFAEIDWNDFVVVSTVELTETDAHIDLPPPMSLREMESMTLAQKRMAAMIMEVEGGGDSDEEKETSSKKKKDSGLVDLGLRGGEMVDAQPVKAGEGAPPVEKRDDGDEDMEMDVSDEEEEKEEQDQDQAQAQAQNSVVPTPTTSNPQIKIRKDYVPKTLAERQAAANSTTLCPVCGLSVPVDEMAEHIRVELLNPRYTQQRAELEAKKAQHAALQEGADPSKFLRHLASNRTDVFGSEAEEVMRAKREEEERRKRREREKIIWDGHTNSAKSTRETFNKNVNQEEVYADMERRRKIAEANAIGPQAVPPSGPRLQNQPPSAPAPASAAAAAGLPARPGAQVGSPVPSGPPVSTGSPAPVAGQKRSAEGELADQPPVQRAAIGSPAVGSPAPPSNAPTAPSSEHSNGLQAAAAAPAATSTPPPGAPTGPKASILEKSSDGSLHAEKDWISSHPNPISIKIQLPEASSISEKCDGSVVDFVQLPPTSTIGSIRDRVQAEYLAGKVGASKLKVKVNGKAATLKQTLAHWNLIDGDLVEVNLNK